MLQSLINIYGFLLGLIELLRPIGQVELLVVIVEALEQILVDGRGLFVVQLGADRVFGGAVVFQVCDFDARAFELLHLVNGTEFVAEVGHDQLLQGQDALIAEGTRTCQIVLITGVVVHASTPLFTNRKLFCLLDSSFEGIFAYLFLLNWHQSNSFALVLQNQLFLPLS